MSIKSRIHLMPGDIVTFKGDAIVNAANSDLAEGAGVCKSIFNAAGSYPLAIECRKFSPVIVGGAITTDACNLKPDVKVIIHAVGPRFRSLKESEPFLKDAYLNSLKELVKHGYKTIAFPCISTGIFGYPLKEASQTAIDTVAEFLKTNKDVEVTFYMFDEKQNEIYTTLLDNLGAK